jgi:hypothetical protein
MPHFLIMRHANLALLSLVASMAYGFAILMGTPLYGRAISHLHSFSYKANNPFIWQSHKTYSHIEIWGVMPGGSLKAIRHTANNPGMDRAYAGVNAGVIL